MRATRPVLMLLLVAAAWCAAPAAAAEPPAESVTVSWVGDMAFSRQHGLPRRPARVFRPVRRVRPRQPREQPLARLRPARAARDAASAPPRARRARRASRTHIVGYRTLSTRGLTALSGVLGVRLARGGRFLGGRLHGLRLRPPGVPVRRGGGRSIRLVRRLSRQDFGRRACRISRRGVVRPR